MLSAPNTPAAPLSVATISAAVSLCDLTTLTLTLALNKAARVGSAIEVKQLLTNAVSSGLIQSLSDGVHLRDDALMNALDSASAVGNLDVMRELVLNCRYDVNDANTVNGLTPLHYAVQLGQMQGVTFLSMVGHADVNRQAFDGRTPKDMSTSKRLKKFLSTIKRSSDTEGDTAAEDTTSGERVGGGGRGLGRSTSGGKSHRKSPFKGLVRRHPAETLNNSGLVSLSDADSASEAVVEPIKSSSWTSAHTSVLPGSNPPSSLSSSLDRPINSRLMPTPKSLTAPAQLTSSGASTNSSGASSGGSTSMGFNSAIAALTAGRNAISLTQLVTKPISGGSSSNHNMSSSSSNHSSSYSSSGAGCGAAGGGGGAGTDCHSNQRRMNRSQSSSIIGAEDESASSASSLLISEGSPSIPPPKEKRSVWKRGVQGLRLSVSSQSKK